jgi:hypothetical protein
MTGYDARQAEGFIRLFGLPLASAALAAAPGAAVSTETNGSPAADLRHE